MKTLTITLFSILLFFSQLFSQDIERLIESKKPPLFEKLYVHVDRELYAPGDKIWMKIYQVNGITHQLNSNFRNVYVQLISEEGKVVKDLYLISINGQASGEFETKLLADGQYTIRAFTKYIENFGEEACFHKKIWISKSFNSVDLTEKEQPNDQKIDVSFLPESGNLVSNAANNVAFKAIDQKGRGIYVSGKILNDGGDIITYFASTYHGMGKFAMMPQDGLNYYATIDQYPEMKISLPPAKANGICMNYKADGESLMFEISVNMNLDKFPEFYFVASHKGIVIFNKKIDMADHTQAIMVDKNPLPKGILKITLLDMSLNPLAERLIFVDNGKTDVLSLRLNQKEFKPREEVKLDIDALLEPGDSIKSTMSVAVVNRNYLSTGENSQNIKSYLLLDSDLKGAIESPAAYFVDDQFHTSAEKLDLLMLVHGWRTYLWDDIEQTPAPSLSDWNDVGTNVSGYIKKLLWKAPVPEAKIAMDYVFRNNHIGTTTADQNGRFLFKNVFFIDTLTVMMNAQTKDGSRNLEIILDPLPEKDSVVSVSLLKSNSFDIDLNPNFNRDNSFRQMKEIEFNPEKGTILLEGVDIVEKKTFSFARSFGVYAYADKTITLNNDDYRFPNIIEYLVNRFASVYVDGDIVTYEKNEVKYMVDGMDFDLRDFKNIRMRDVETLDIWTDEINRQTVFAIYRKPDYLVAKYDMYKKGRIIPEIRGFDRPAIFYSPKYTLENIDSPRPDFRPTLYWNPDVSFVNGKANLDFFTSDEATDYVVYLEGITKNGKICFGTTSFKVDKK